MLSIFDLFKPLFYSQQLGQEIQQGALAELAEQVIPEIGKEESGKQRSIRLRVLGKKILESARNLPEVNWRQFALMHNSAMIRETSLAGGFFNDSIEAWKAILEIWQKSDPLYFSCYFPEKAHFTACQVLEDLKYFESLFPPLCTESLPETQLLSCAKKLHKELTNALIKKKTVYLPIAYRHGVANEGHAMPAKFVLEEDRTVTIYVLNLGDGAGEHPVLNYTTSQEKISFRSYPIQVDVDVFWGEMGFAALCHLIRYHSEPPRPDQHHYEGEDIYNIFRTLGTLVPDLGEHPEALAAKGQRGPSCTEKGVKNVVHDVLVEYQVPLKETKKIFLNVYFCSLISGYHSYLQNPDEKKCILLRDAAVELAITLEKLQNEISQEEYIAASSVIMQIKKATKTTELKIPKTQADLPKEKKIRSFPAEFPKIEENILTSSITTKATPKSIKKVARIYAPTFEIQLFSKQLDEWIDTLSQFSDPKERFRFFYACTKVLPIPEWDKKCVWDTVSDKAVSQLLQKMETLMILGLKEIAIAQNIHQACFLDQVLAIHTLYVIADKLARNCKWTKLEGFASPFVPLQHPYVIPDFTTIPLGFDNHRYSQISNYFKESRKKNQYKVIFPVEPTLAVQQYVYDSTHHGQLSQGKSHIEFLRHHLYERYPQSANSLLARPSHFLWKEMKKELPAEVNSLYYFAFVASILFYGKRGDDSSFPTALKFVDGVDGSGLKALVIEGDVEKLFHKHPQEMAKRWEELWDYRFDEMQIGGDRNSCIDIFGPTYQGLSTNDAVCIRLPEEEMARYRISESIFRDLIRITRKENLKLPLALHWASTNLVHLDHKGIQWFLGHCFFSPGSLYERLKQEPELIHALREFVAKGLDYYRDNSHHLSTILYLIRTGICFETHYANLYGVDKIQTTLSYYQEKISKLKSDKLEKNESSQLIMHTLLIDLYSTQRSKDEEIEFLKRLFRFSEPKQLWSHDYDYKWLKERIDSTARHFIFKLQDAFKVDQGFCNRVCHALLQEFIPEMAISLKDSVWSGEFPSFSCHSYVVNFFERRIEHREKGFLRNEIPALVESDWHFLTRGKKFWCAEGRYESLDGTVNFACDHDNDRLVVRKEIVFKGEKRWAKGHIFSCLEIDKVDLDFLNYREFLPYAHYVLEDKREGDPTFLTYDYKTNRPILRIDYTSKGAEYTKLDQNGEVLPIKMANLSRIRDQSLPLYRYAARFSHTSRVLCFVNTTTGLIEELNFFYLNLSFVRTAHGMESVQYPGYYLQLDERLEELNSFSAVMILKSLTDERKILIPAMNLQACAEDFSKEVTFGKENISRGKYFACDVDPVNETLISKKNAANLYIALLLKMQRDEVKALKYLKRVQANDYFDFDASWMLDQFTYLRNASPAAHAFNAKLVFLCIDNLNLMLEGRFGVREHERHFNTFLAWAEKAYVDYLKTMSSESVSSIPKELRLTVEEEKSILRTLKRKKEEKEITQQDKGKTFPKILALRFELLCTGKEKVTATITKNKEVLLRPLAYQHLSPPRELYALTRYMEKEFPYGEKRLEKAKPGENFDCMAFPNRLTKEAMLVHFPDLYEKARACRANTRVPFDFTLLAFLKLEKDSSHHNDAYQLGSLLFYVRHFSYLFTDLSFKGVTKEIEKVAIFKQIVQRVCELEDSFTFKRFKKEYLEEKGTFHFEKQTELFSPLTIESVGIPLAKEREEGKWIKAPLRSFCEVLFTKTIKTVCFAEEPPFLDEKLSPLPNTFEADLVEKFTQGYEKLKERTTFVYTLHSDELTISREGLLFEKKRIHKILCAKREEFITKINTPYKVRSGALQSNQEVFEEIDFRNKRQALQTMPILPETVMKEVILRGNPAFLKKHCPLLKENEVQEIINHVCDYYHLLAFYQLCEESIILIDKIQKQPSDVFLQNELAQKLDYEFLDHRAYPEISYFKVTEGKIPRKEQAEIYKWVCEGLAKKESRLFQHKAGGGKTDYLTPLMMLRIRRENLMPVFFSTPMIYAVDKVNLSATLQKLDNNLIYLEVGMHMKLSSHDMKFIYEQLQEYYQEGRGLIMTPQTFYALRLQYYFAGIREKDVAKVKYLGLILNFFETKCCALGDEGHHNYDPMTRAIFGVGEYFYLPKEESALFIALMKPLMGFEEVLDMSGRPVSAVSKLEKNLLGAPSADDVKEVQLALAKHMSASSLLEIPDFERPQIIEYWTNKKSKQPLFLKALAKEDHSKANLIALTGYFLLDLLPHIVKMRTELDHSKSIFQEEEFDTPCHHKTPSTAQYEDSYLSSALTIKGTSHRGLQEGQIRKLILKLINLDWKEQQESGSDHTKISEMFRTWTQKSSFERINLRDISLNNPKLMRDLTEVFAHHPLVIEYYLQEFILPQIGYALQQLSCTPAHLTGGFLCSLLFTATPVGAIYPEAIKEIRYDPVFEAEVVTEFCKIKNQKKIFVEGPETFFKENTFLGSGTVFLDPSGFFCDEKNEALAKKWLESSDLDGVFYFKEARSLKVNKDEKVCLLLRGAKAPIELAGSNQIEEELAAHKISWKELKLGTYFDASHTESANILQKVGTTAFVFIADNLTASRLIQALMRLRGLLDEKMIQNVIWIYPNEVAKKIPLGSSGDLDGPALFTWSIGNEVEQMKKKIVLAAFQEIAFKVEGKATKKLKNCLHEPEKQIALMQKYQKGLLEQNRHDPYATYGEHEYEEKVGIVLMDYAQGLYERYHYSVPFAKNQTLLGEIKTIIKNIEKRIQTVTTNWDKALSLAVELHTRLKKETEQQHYRPRPFDPISAEGIYGDLGVDKPDYPHRIPKQNVRAIFQTEGLTANFYFEKNQILTAKNAGKSMDVGYLKPIDFFEILIPNNQVPMAVVYVNEIISSNLEILAKDTTNPDVTHKAFLVTAEGKLIQRGKGRLAPTDEELERILKSQWMKDLVIDAAILKGQMVHPDRLLERLKNWKDFPVFWEKVVAAQPNPETVNKSAFNRLISSLK